jgi:hypothetical protein
MKRLISKREADAATKGVKHELPTTFSEAQMLSGHIAVIWVEGISGAYLLNRVKPSIGGDNAA